MQTWKPIDFAIITIRDDEYRAVAHHFPLTSKDRGPSRRIYNFGTVQTKDGKAYSVAVARSAADGPQAAQQLASDMISDLSPSLLLVVGIAGGVPDNDFTLGDVVVSSRVLDFGVNAYKPDGIAWDVRGGANTRVEDIVANLVMYDTAFEGWNTPAVIGMARPVLDRSKFKDFDLSLMTEEERRALFDGPVLASWQQKIMESLQLHFGDQALPEKRSSYVTGSIAASGSLVRDVDILKQWLLDARGIRAVEMETGGVFQAARQLRQDYPVIAIRGISDIVGLKREQRWISYACHSAAAFAYAFLTADSSMFDNICRHRSVTTSPARTQGSTPAAVEDDGSVKIYIIYDKEDEKYERELAAHLKLLQRQHYISTFHSHQLDTENPAEALDPHLDAARIVLLLISPAFMASDLNYDYEMKRAFQRRDTEKISVVPIILRDADLEGTPIPDLQALPKSRKPIASQDQSGRDEAWVEVAKSIRDMCKILSSKSEDQHG